MKFKNYLTSIAGVDIFPLISLMIFFLFFTILLIYVVKISSKSIVTLEQLPLDDNKNESNENAAL
jgi:cytochrome c oxidase cbb3-type subunit 3